MSSGTEAAGGLLGWTTGGGGRTAHQGTAAGESSRRSTWGRGTGGTSYAGGSFEGEVRYRHKDGPPTSGPTCIPPRSGRTKKRQRVLVASFRDVSRAEAHPGGDGLGGRTPARHRRGRSGRPRHRRPRTVRSLPAQRRPAQHLGGRGAGAVCGGVRGLQGVLAGDGQAAQSPRSGRRRRALKTGESFADVVVDIDRFDGTRGTIVLSTAPIRDNGAILGAVTIVAGHHAHARGRAGPAVPHGPGPHRSTRPSCSTRSPSSTAAGRAAWWRRPGLLLGSDGSSIFLLGGDGSLRRVAGVGAPDPEGIDDRRRPDDRRPRSRRAAVRAGGAGGRRDARQHARSPSPW